MANCGVCVKAISSKQLKLACSDCESDFHGSCLKMSKADVDCITADGMNWRCTPCAKKRRKSLRFESDAGDGKLTLYDVMKTINEIVENQKMQEKSFNASYELIHEKLEENIKCVKDQNKSIEKCLKMIDQLVEENTSLNKKVLDLERHVDDMEQYSQVNAVEIHGIPVAQNEDVLNVVKELEKALDMNIVDTMVDACHRLGKKPGPKGEPPGIIVKFVRRFDKEELLRKRRVKKEFSTRHMNMNVDTPVYINESLSAARRRLVAAAREVKRERQYKYLWVRGGKIFLRKEDSATVIKVACQADLDSFPNTPGLRDWQKKEHLEDLLKKVIAARNSLTCLKKPPIVLKLAPDLSSQEKKDITHVIKKPECRVDGLIISNTTVTRDSDLTGSHKEEVGGLSGRPLNSLSTQLIAEMYIATQGKIPIIGVGGVFTGEDAYNKILAGASLIQIYTAYIYHGPPRITRIKKELDELLKKNGYSSLADAVGKGTNPDH